MKTFKYAEVRVLNTSPKALNIIVTRKTEASDTFYFWVNLLCLTIKLRYTECDPHKIYLIIDNVQACVASIAVDIFLDVSWV